MADVTLFFGIGATKAGTSWLQYYLSRHPEVHLWVHKELHYFDALDRDRVMEQLDEFCERRMALRARMKGASGQDRARLRKDVAELDRYLALLARGKENANAYVSFLKKGRRGAGVVGDITPAYALLSEERLRKMAALAPVTRFIYLLRDPIERLWSNVRMMAARQAGAAGDVAAQANRIFDRWTRGEEKALGERCDYAGALTRLTAAVPQTDRLIAFHEEIFSEQGVRQICQFLGIGYEPAPLEQRVHVGPALDMSDARRAIAAERLAPQYEFVERSIGRVPAAWRTTAVEG